MLSRQEEEAERRATLVNDRRVREQSQQAGTTFKAFADADAEIPGRFQNISAAHVVGSAPTPKYPAASPPFQRDPVPDEPPLGVEINRLTPYELEPSFASLSSAQTGGADGAPSASDVEHAAPPSSHIRTRTNDAPANSSRSFIWSSEIQRAACCHGARCEK